MSDWIERVNLLEPPTIFTADPDFVDLARDEVAAIAQILATDELTPGVYRLESRPSFWEIAQRWSETPPIFVRHICPAQLAIPLQGTPGDLAMLAQGLQQALLDLIDPELTFSVQSRILAELPYKPFDINKQLSTLIQEQTAAALDVRKPEQIISVVCAQTPSGTPTGFIGISPTLFNLSDWAGGMRRFARETGQVSRAEFKLLEAFEVFHLQPAPYLVALDLGASPGGWTRVLRQRNLYVTAIDPGELAPALLADKGIRHIRTTAETYLQRDPDQFDIIVNDMRMDARDSARLMVQYAPLIHKSGIALMTLKLPTRKRSVAIDHAFNILRQVYQIAGARQLFHNRSEITLYLRPKR